MSLLLVEDETKTVAYLRQGLRESGFAVDTVCRGDEGLQAALTQRYDLIILDVMLPGIDGWTVLAEMRRSGAQTPVLFLTARDAVEDRVRGLELGADDYLVKPFAFAELLARVRSLLRRTPVRSHETVEVADLAIDLIRQRVQRADREIDLTHKEFLLLSLLARRAGEVQTRAVIAQEVWDMSFDSGTNNVDVAVRRLRRKVDEPCPLKLIHTVHGVGYVLRDQ